MVEFTRVSNDTSKHVFALAPTEIAMEACGGASLGAGVAGAGPLASPFGRGSRTPSKQNPPG